MNESKKLPKNVISLGFVSFLNDAASEMIYPLLPVFLTKVLGAGPGFLGVIEGIAEATASLLKLFSGYISDRFKRSKILIFIGYALATFGRPLIAFTRAWWHVAIIRFIDRVGKGIRTSPRDALISHSVSPDIKGKAFGFHRAMDHLGAIVGPLTAMILLKFGLHMKTVFLLAVIPGIISLFILFFFVEEKVDDKKHNKLNFNLKVFPFSFKYYLFVVILFTLSNSSDTFLIFRANEVGVSIAMVPLLWMVLHFVKALLSIPGGIWSDKVGRKLVIITGWIVYALIYLGFGFATRLWHIWLLFALYGIYFALTEGVEKAFVSDLSPKDYQGTAFGLFNLSIGIAAFPSSVIFGFIYQSLGGKFAFIYGASLALLSSILLLFVNEKVKKD